MYHSSFRMQCDPSIFSTSSIKLSIQHFVLKISKSRRQTGWFMRTSDYRWKLFLKFWYIMISSDDFLLLCPPILVVFSCRFVKNVSNRAFLEAGWFNVRRKKTVSPAFEWIWKLSPKTENTGLHTLEENGRFLRRYNGRKVENQHLTHIIS